MLATIKKTPLFRFYVASGGALVLLLITITIIIFVQDENLRMVITDILFPAANILVVGALFTAAKRSSVFSMRMFWVWVILAIAQLSYTVADSVWGFLETVLAQTPFPSIADVFYLFYYPAFMVGILLLPSRKSSLTERVKSGLDMGVIMITSGLLFWNFLIRPIAISEAGDTMLAQLLSLAYPIGDILLTWALLMLLYRKQKVFHRGVLYLLVATMIVMVITDTIFSYQSMNGMYVSGDLLDIGWFAAYLLTGLAGILQATTAQVKIEETGTVPKDRSKFQAAITHMPYVWVILAFWLISLGYFSELYIDRVFLVIGVGLVIAMVILRQVLSFRENDALNSQLNLALVQVQTQKSELEKTNQELTVEISERKRAEERLSFDALHDGLTGLPNRVLFMDRLGQAIEYTKRRPDYLFSVLFLDLDQFKVVNDSLGHTVGDQLLVAIACQLKLRLRTSDTIARLGGDEFVFLLENILAEGEVTLVANRILNELKSTFVILNHEVHISGSIGIVSSVANYNFPEEVLRDADIAMYRAKATGKARFEIFNTNLRTQAIRRLELENELRYALENQEFELHYQPIITVESNKLTGFEALIRWNHPSNGLIMPADFVPVAEESGLIQSIGEWVLYEACTQMKKWKDAIPSGQSLVINVNISGKQFTQPNFVGLVKGVINQTGLNPSDLKLEITETSLIENSLIANDVFRELSAIGVQLQIDDFGTGYSSLGYLQHFPIHTIKIDRTFVNEMRKGKKGTDIIRAMILMANDLGMDTIAEGVETQDQLRQLKSLACKYVQGYLFAKPMDNGMAAELIQRDLA